MRKTARLTTAVGAGKLRSSGREGTRVRAVVLPGECKTMERVTLRIPKQQIEEVEQMVETSEFPNRSEAIRSAVRDMLNEQADTSGERTRGERSKRSWAKV